MEKLDVSTIEVDGNKVTHLSYGTLPNETERLAAEYEPMVVEGRTWWYGNSEWVRNEFGVRIGSAITIDGVEWNKVYVCLHHKLEVHERIDNTYDWLNLDEDDGLIAYIREEDGKVYARTDVNNGFPEHCFPFGLPLPSALFNNDESMAKIYDFKIDGNSFVLGNEGHATEDDTPLFEFELLDSDVVESHGNTYRRMHCQTDSPEALCSEVYFIEGIGVVGYDDTESSVASSIFYTPFHRYYTAIGAPGVPVLRYVTDESNEIIYEHSGGVELWKDFENAENVYTGVNNVVIEPAGANTLEYYNLQGIKINAPQPGMYVIIRQGNNVVKKRF